MRENNDTDDDGTRTRLDYKSSALAIELNRSKVIAGKELSLSSWCIASLYIYHFSTVVDFSSKKYSGSTGHRNSWYQWRKEMSGQSIISIIFTDLGPFSANSVITFGLSFSNIRYASIFQKLRRFPGN